MWKLNVTAVQVADAKRELRRMGDRNRTARLASKLPMQLLVKRALATRQASGGLEAVDARVAFGTVLETMNAIGLLDITVGTTRKRD